METAIPLTTLKESYKNILAYVVKRDKASESRLACLTKWGGLLGFRQVELQRYILTPALLTYLAPANNTEALSQVYDLVYIVNMDGVIEDVELELVSVYALGIGLEAHVVNNLLKALVTAQFDGISNESIRLDIQVHPEVYV